MTNHRKKYPKIEGPHNARKSYVQMARGRDVYWEPKRDGSNITILQHKGMLLVYTRNQLAVESVQLEVLELIKPFEEGLRAALGDTFQIYGELIRKGKSPAQFEEHDEPSWLAFDIYDYEAKRFLEVPDKLKIFKKHGIPHISFYINTCNANITDFRQTCNNMIDDAKDAGLEGYVAKWFVKDEMFMLKCKVEQKYPRDKKKKFRAPRPSVPDLEFSEVMGAIDKVYNDLGPEDFLNKSLSMPAIAAAVKEECRKHSKRNPYSLFPLYVEYLEGKEEN